jgi:2-C-methyl-D-erythritol 2,4-cyclodiphosphate synthase
MSESALSPELLEAVNRAVDARVAALAPRVGIGYDIHRFVSGRPLILGGVEVAADQGLEGHSDADAATHAVIDAILGAACLGDIGHFFPDTDPRWKGADSQRLLAGCRERIEAEGWRVSSVDVTVIAEKPRLAPHVPAMRQALARTLGLSVDAVSLKATTHEKLGALGRREGLAAIACALLMRSDGHPGSDEGGNR